MNEITKSVKLENGMSIPNLCFGSSIVLQYRAHNRSTAQIFKYWMYNYLKNKRQFNNDVNMKKIVRMSMENGCTMFDTSRAYAGSEYVLGKSLKDYERSEYKIITKLCNADQYSGNIAEALKRSLNELEMEYVDVYLMHWPVPDRFVSSWKQMELLYKEGLCKAIGVCNFNIHHLKELLKYATIKPMINQIECHPLFTQEALREYCLQNHIQVMAYTSTARMDDRLRKTALTPIAKKYNKTIAQIILRWHQQIGNIPIVNSSNPKHMYENTQIYDFSLSDEEIGRISSININSRLRYDSDNCDFTQL